MLQTANQRIKRRHVSKIKQIEHVGILLETGLKDCTGSPCENGGSCTDNSAIDTSAIDTSASDTSANDIGAGVTCQCTMRYAGHFCERKYITLAYVIAIC